MYYYRSPNFYEYTQGNFYDRNYYNQYRFNNIVPYSYNYWQFDMHSIYKIRQPVKKDRLNRGEKLLPNESLWSQNGQYALIMQADGNLVQYKSGVALWASGTTGKKVDFAILQDDGNFVIYGEGKPLWASGTTGNTVSYLIVQNDGNIVIYDVNNKPVWTKDTKPHTDELVVLTKTLISFHYPYTIVKTRKFRAYLEVKVPKEIAETTQSSLDNCMEIAKSNAIKAFAGCFTVPTCVAAVPAALGIAMRSFTTCVSANPQIYPYINKIKVDIKTDKNA